jgi:metallo-beta-lactamase family protein
MEIEFVGAAREVTGSCHIVRANGKTILLDCGMFQGRRSESEAKNRKLPVPVAEIDAVILSHAHLDHAGRLPLLARAGYSGPIHTTSATADLTAIMLADSARIQENDYAFLLRKNRNAAPPLYEVKDAARVEELVRRQPYDQWFDVVPGIRARFTDAGHILGSASVVVESTESGGKKTLVFSGDVGRWGLPIIRDPSPPTDAADVVILESTYGNRDHESVEGAQAHLARVVRETAAKGGRVLIPAFAVGRAQELVYDLHRMLRAGEIPRVPIVIDSPLATLATAVFEHNAELFDQTEKPVREIEKLFRYDMLSFTNNTEESKALNARHGPLIIIAGSGMAEGGRIVHHLAHGASNPRNTILIVGFQAEHTLGRRIVERRPTIKVFGDEVELRANVEVLNGYSAHADRTELANWLAAVKKTSPALKQVYLVHGEAEAQDAFAAQLAKSGYKVSAPEPHTRVVV